MSDYTPPTLVIPTPGGSAGDGSMSGKLTLKDNTAGYGAYPTANTDTILAVGSAGKAVLNATPGDVGPAFPGDVRFGGTVVIDSGIDAENAASKFTAYAGITVVGLGVAPFIGKDVRTGLTAADASATTLYTTTAAGQLYRLMGRILATAGTSPSATYTIK